MEAGFIVDEEGTAPVHLDVRVDQSLQRMLQAWIQKKSLHALLKPANFACIALPRFVGRSKNCAAVSLQEHIGLPFFTGAEPTSGHSRGFVNHSSPIPS